MNLAFSRPVKPMMRKAKPSLVSKARSEQAVARVGGLIRLLRIQGKEAVATIQSINRLKHVVVALPKTLGHISSVREHLAITDGDGGVMRSAETLARFLQPDFSSMIDRGGGGLLS